MLVVMVFISGMMNVKIPPSVHISVMFSQTDSKMGADFLRLGVGEKSQENLSIPNHSDGSASTVPPDLLSMLMGSSMLRGSLMKAETNEFRLASWSLAFRWSALYRAYLLRFNATK